ncbi:hypothetical protein [Streptomyces heilongjiangensis]|uniref:Uncharacterized protein n=1 Tax=Streptomyces heilongjiangensis TaxID=945052 RepID=A0ABW1BJ15_9ACTN|nr:hypothetical protein [Streptomyces heilongjiangensis]MDC2951048.1 hypothetical protein [Streptomyces heilongjiangensis]
MSPKPALNLTSVSTRSDDDLDDEQLGIDDVDQGQARRGGRAAGGVVAGLTGADVSTPVSVVQLPTPYDVEETVTRPLNEDERADLAVCEQALRGFRKSAIVAGKALEVINRGRLYRDTHATFVEYLDDVWEIRKSQAYRMIEAWPVAAAVSPIGDINEGQARELRPVLKDYGQEAAVALYREVKELRGERKVTAADLAEARAVLPPPRMLARPEQVRDVLTLAASEGRAPRLAPPPAPVPEQKAGPCQADDEGGVTQTEVDAGAEAMAILEDAAAHQELIEKRVTAQVLANAQLYDTGRADRLQERLREASKKVTHRMRDPHSGDA